MPPGDLRACRSVNCHQDASTVLHAQSALHHLLRAACNAYLSVAQFISSVLVVPRKTRNDSSNESRAETRTLYGLLSASSDDSKPFPSLAVDDVARHFSIILLGNLSPRPRNPPTRVPPLREIRPRWILEIAPLSRFHKTARSKKFSVIIFIGHVPFRNVLARKIKYGTLSFTAILSRSWLRLFQTRTNDLSNAFFPMQIKRRTIHRCECAVAGQGGDRDGTRNDKEGDSLHKRRATRTKGDGVPTTCTYVDTFRNASRGQRWYGGGGFVPCACTMATSVKVGSS